MANDERRRWRIANGENRDENRAIRYPYSLFATQLFRRLVAAQHPRQREEHVLIGGGDGLDGHRVALGESADDLLDQHLGRGRAGGDADAGDGAEQRPVDVLGALHQRGACAAGALGHFPQALRVGGIGRAHHHHGVDHGGDPLHHLLAVGGGVADVFLVRSNQRREARLQRLHDLAGVIDRERGLRDVGEVAGIARREARNLLDRLQQGDGAGGQLPDRSHNFRVAGMADQHDLAATLVVDLGLAVNLGDQRTGGVEGEEIALLRLGRNRLRHPVSGEDHGGAGFGDLVELLDEYRSLGLEALDHVAVVHDLVAHIDRCAITRESLLDRIDGAHDPRAEAARRAQQHFQRGFAPAFRHIG